MRNTDLRTDAQPRKPRVVSVGELLWDLFPGGALLGGSSANVAFHAAALGAQSALISRVGNDPLGRQAVTRLSQAGVNTDSIQVDRSTETGQVHVAFQNGQPVFTIGTQSAWDRIEVPAATRSLLHGADVVCFGTLVQRTPLMKRTLSREFQRLSGSGSPWLRPGSPYRRPVLLLDLNLRPPYTDQSTIISCLDYADVVKLNEQELDWVAESCSTRDPIDWLLSRGGVRLVALTRGAEGASLLSPVLSLSVPGIPVHGGDPVGAGDAFVASLAVSLALGTSLAQTLERANRHASWVASCPGAMPESAVPDRARPRL